MPEYKLYPNGTPIEAYAQVSRDLDKQIIRKNRKKPSCILIDGSLGSGKTTISIELLDEINRKHGLPEVDLDEKDICQYAMGGADFIKKYSMVKLKNLPGMIYDEAGEFSRKAQLSRFVRNLERIFDLIRLHPMTIIIILPSIKILPDDFFIKKIPRILFHLKERDSSGKARVYSLRTMYYIRRNLQDKKTVIPEVAYDVERHCYTTRFKDLTPERSHKLEVVNTKGKGKIFDQIELNISGLLSYKEISQKIGMRTESWVKSKIKELKIPPDRVFKKKNYYYEPILDRLLKEIKN